MKVPYTYLLQLFCEFHYDLSGSFNVLFFSFSSFLVIQITSLKKFDYSNFINVRQSIFNSSYTVIESKI